MYFCTRIYCEVSQSPFHGIRGILCMYGWKNITITPLVIVSYPYFYIMIINESSLIK